MTRHNKKENGSTAVLQTTVIIYSSDRWLHLLRTFVSDVGMFSCLILFWLCYCYSQGISNFNDTM